MEQLIAQYPWLVFFFAILVGMLIMWLLEMFVLRRSIKGNVTGLESTLKQRDAELQTTKNILTQTETDLKARNGELQSALTERETLDRQLGDTKSLLTKTNADLDGALKMRQQLESTLNTRTGELVEERTKLRNLSDEREQLRAKILKTEKELADSREQHRSAAAEVAKLTAAAAATAAVVKGLETSKGDLTAKITALNGELTATRGDAETLRRSLDEANAARAKLESALTDTINAKANLENELADTNTAKAELENTLAGQTQRAGDLEEMIRGLQGQIEEIENKNRALDADIAKLTAGALAAAEVIRQLESDKAGLTEQHAELQGSFENLQKAKALDDADLATLKVQLSQVDTALGITKHDKETYQQTLAERVSELGAAQTELTRAKDDNSNLLADIAKFSARAATAAVLVQGLESDKRELNALVEKLRTELDAERERRTALETESATLTQAAAPTPAPSVSTETAVEAITESETAEESEANDNMQQPLEAVCPQDLSEVNGIGPDFEQRLYNAGIGTYWDVAELSDEKLADILELNKTQRLAINLAAIRGNALDLARQTKSQKRTWKGGIPDDFDIIVGIGRVYEKRLYEAGICTYEALAASNAEELSRICHAPHYTPNHYQNWIDQARTLIAARRKGL